LDNDEYLFVEINGNTYYISPLNAAIGVVLAMATFMMISYMIVGAILG
jgi:hypothetical protein